MIKKTSLLKYQENLKNYLVGIDNIFFETVEDRIEVPLHCKNPKEFAEQRLSIYKNNIYHGLAEALENLYPVICRVVGKDYFGQLAKAYLLKYFPNSSVLNQYGEFFPEFIADIYSCSHLPYLEDLARLEWYFHTALHAADEKGFDLDQLTSLSEENLEKLCLNFRASVFLMESDFPVDDIWLENQKSEVGILEVGRSKKRYLLISRKEYKVQMILLESIVFYFLLYLCEGHAVAQAWRLVKLDVEEEISDESFLDVFVYVLSLSIFVN